MEQVKERTMTLACGALCALVFVSALFTPGQARGAAFAEPADATELPVLMVDPGREPHSARSFPFLWLTRHAS